MQDLQHLREGFGVLQTCRRFAEILTRGLVIAGFAQYDELACRPSEAGNEPAPRREFRACGKAGLSSGK